MAFHEFDSALLSRRSLLRGGAWLGAGAALLGLPLGRMALARTPADQWPHVAALVESWVSRGKVANMVAALGWGQDDPAYLARGTLAFGGDARAGADSLYRIYSMTKPVTGMATMMLIDEGKLGLDQPLAEVLPDFADMRVLENPDGPVDRTVPATRPITIRQLLTHTAGLGYNIVQTGPIKALYERQGLLPGQISRIPIPGSANYATAESLEVFARRLARVPLVYQPGSRWSYSLGIDLLGRVIEVASGMAFDAFLRQRIFEPCGMGSTWFRVPESEIGRFTTNYYIIAGVPIPIDPAAASIYLDEPPFPFGGAGLVSSPRDYDRFLRMLLGYGQIDGTRVMSEAAVRLGTSNLLPDTATTKGSWIEGHGFGAGGRVSKGSYGWAGAAGTFAFINHARNLRAGLYTQFMPFDTGLEAAFPKAVLADLAATKAEA